MLLVEPRVDSFEELVLVVTVALWGPILQQVRDVDLPVVLVERPYCAAEALRQASVVERFVSEGSR